MPLVWPVLTDAERAGSPDSARASTPWSVFLIAVGALLVAGSLFKLAWRARSHLRRHPPLRQPHLLKYLAGPEIGGGNFVSDTSPEAKAAELRALPSLHYKQA